jgi:hypothetical protein
MTLVEITEGQYKGAYGIVPTWNPKGKVQYVRSRGVERIIATTHLRKVDDINVQKSQGQ